MSVVGFDFGNNSCKIAICRKGHIEVIMNDCSNRNTPSVVGYTDGARQIGEAGLAQAVTNFKNTVTEVKRLLGRSWVDQELQRDVASLPYKIEQSPSGGVVIDVSYSNERVQLSPEQVTGALFAHLKALAEHVLEGVHVSDVVISVPPFFTDQMRRAMLNAAHIAGLNVLRLMNENSAIALQYGLLRQLPESNPMKVLFFDMGHSQTTATLVTFIQGSLTMLGSASHRTLGGRDFDTGIANHLFDYAQTKYKLDLRSSVKARLRVEKQCERIKKMLTANQECPYNLECIMNDVDVKGSLSREEFEKLSAPLLEQMLIPVREVLAATGMEAKDIEHIELVGGGSRVLSVRRALKEFFGKELSTTCNADESVARGCALQCAMLSPSVRVREFTVNDVTPLSVTVGWQSADALAEEESVELFTRYNGVPSIKQIQFTKNGPFTISARYTRESDLPAGLAPFIARWSLDGLPAGVQTKQKVKVKLDFNGLISLVSAQALEELSEEASATEAAASPSDKMDVEAKDNAADSNGDEKKKKKYKKTELSYSSVFTGLLSTEQVKTAVEVESAQANQDRVIAETAEKRNELEGFIYETRSAIEGELAPFLTLAAVDELQSKLMREEDWLNDSMDQDPPVQKSDYVRHLADLRALIQPAQHRRREQQQRSGAVSTFKSALTKYRLQASSPDAKYAHIEGSEKAKVTAAVDEQEQWLQGVLLQQEARASHEDPLFTIADLDARRVGLERLADPILTKPAPKPQPAPAPAAAPQPAAADAAAAPAQPEAAAAEPQPAAAEQPAASPSNMEMD